MSDKIQVSDPYLSKWLVNNYSPTARMGRQFNVAGRDGWKGVLSFYDWTFEHIATWDSSTQPASLHLEKDESGALTFLTVDSPQPLFLMGGSDIFYSVYLAGPNSSRSLVERGFLVRQS
jgi:hypothetical protein